MKTKIIPVISIATLLFCKGTVRAQESAAQRHVMATNQLRRVALEMSARCLSEIRTREDWQRQRRERRRELLDMLGLDPLPLRTPLHAQIMGRLDRPEYRVEKIVFQSMPGLYVTGNFYVPKELAKPLPAILYLCGHSPHPLGAKVEYQDRAIWFASHGYACLVLDTLEFGEVAGIHHGTHNLNMWHWLSLGYTPAGTEVWSAMRALDYLETRPEVDAKHIGVTGISGGGAMTWYTAAVDERVAAAVPVCSTFTFGSQADHWLASGQCDCIYYHNTYAWDFPVVGALIAPRPLLILSGRKDTIFPPDGYHAAFQHTKPIYDLYADGGSSERIRELDDNVPHSDPPLFLKEARQWMQRWLKGDSTPLPEEPGSSLKEAGEDLACLMKLPADATNYRIHNRFVPTVSVKTMKSRSAWEQRRAELLIQLKDKVFRWFPTEKIPFETTLSKSGGGWVPRYVDYTQVSFQSEEGVRVRAQLLKPRHDSPDARLVIYVKRAGDSVYSSDFDELTPLFDRCTVLILFPRFSEQSMTAAEYTDIERTAAWVGRTIASMQVWDILRTIEWAVSEEKITGRPISIYGKGDMGILALYAALFDQHLQQVILNDPPGSHWQHPALLNVLRVTDIAEVAGALAPRPLTCLTDPPKSFDQTRKLYKLQGNVNQFDQAASLPEALQIWKYPNRK